MKSAPINEDEQERLAALQRYAILDTLAEEEFDDFTRLASQICNVPIALISLVDTDRQWFKSKVGIDAPETPRDISFCGHAIHGREIFEIPNAFEDERFSDNPLVTDGPGIRFYAGMPLVSPDGHGIGTLCVIDSVPHTLTDQQREALAALARQVVRQLELRLVASREHQLHDTLARQSVFHKTLLDSAALAIISTTIEGVITSFNPAAEKMLGYSADELVGKQTPALLHVGAEVVARAQELSEELGRVIAPGFDVFVIKALAGEPETRDWTYVRKDGGSLPVRLSVSAMFDEDGVLMGYLGIASDISREKTAQKAIQEFKTTLDQTLDCVFMFDAETLQFFYVNQGALEQVGYTQEELMQMHPFDIKPDISEEQFNALIKPLVSGEMNSLTFDTDHQHKNGMRVPVEIFLQYIAPQGERARFVAIVRDITERKATARALRESAQHTQAILDNVVDGIITINRLGSVQTFNKAAETIFGYQAEEVVGQNINMLMPEPYHSVHDDYLHKYDQTGVPHIIGTGREVQGLRKNGDNFPMDLAVSESTRDGRPLFIGLVRDITERKRMEQMKAEFVSTVSHELRTPLTSISGALGLLVGGALGELPEQARQMLHIAHKNSQRLAHLINDLLDMEKLAAGKMRLDLQLQTLMPLVEQALESIHAYGEQYQVNFELVERADDVQVRVDAARLQQVLANFLSNAAKFSPQGGQVEIAVRQGKAGVRIEVVDHGEGIPDEFRSRIFQKFSQADSSDTRQKGGTGLGLAISKELIECMNGKVDFDSVVGQGSRFYCELPVWDKQLIELSRDVIPPSREAPRLLVVEDEPDIAQLLQILLSRAGYRVDIALNGETALAALSQNSYAAMTLDLMLPDQSGVALIKQIRSRAETVALPIIVVSASSEDGKLEINGDFTAVDWLDKPIEEKHLLDAVRRALPVDSAARPHVLHVEDDADLHSIIATIGKDLADFDLARSLAEARDKLNHEHYSLVILDIVLPDGSGWDLLPLLKSLDPEPPVIVLSGAEPTQAERAAVSSILLKARTSNQDFLQMLKHELTRRSSLTEGRQS